MDYVSLSKLTIIIKTKILLYKRLNWFWFSSVYVFSCADNSVNFIIKKYHKNFIIFYIKKQ